MNRFKSGVIGHAIGDALGVQCEFSSRDYLKDYPITGFKDTDFRLGWWSDDTSMELALMDSYIKNKSFNYSDIMNNFVLWVDKGDFTPEGHCFDVGSTCYSAISYFRDSNKTPLECGLDDINSNGNGSLMRIFPIAYYCFKKNSSILDIYSLVRDISSITHRHSVSILGCFIYVLYCIKLFEGNSKNEAYNYVKSFNYDMFDIETISYYDRILKNDISSLDISSIKSSGYIVDSLEASFYCLLTTDNYNDAVLKAINLGGDTDTIGAITGSMAGVIYGMELIPDDWINTISREDYIEELCDKFDLSI